MTAHYYEAVAEIPVDHCLHLQLPPEIPVGSVRVTINYESATDSVMQDCKKLLAAMPNVGKDSDFSRQQEFESTLSEDAVMTVTGELQRIDFAARQVTILYPPTRREITCTYLPEIEDSIIESRKEPIQVTGRFVLDDDGNPCKLMDVTRIAPIDLSPLLITEVDAISVRFKEPLELTPYLDEESQQYLVVEEPTLAINAFALNREQLFDEVQEQLVMLWREYACAEDSELTIEARQLKHGLLSKMESCNA